MTPMMRNSMWLPDVFNDFFNYGFAPKASGTEPAVNVAENDKEYKLEIAAPGMQKEDLNVRVNNNDELVIAMEKKSGDKNAEGKDGKKNADHYLRREFSYSQFKQVMTLPDDVDKDAISAKVENGILTVELPKKAPEKPADNSKLIEVK